MKTVAAVKQVASVASQGACVRLLIKEVGSPRLESGSAEAFDETVVISQMKDESRESFTERSLDRVASLARSGRRLGAITLQVGTAHDARAGELRRSLLLALLESQQLATGPTEVLVEAPAKLGSDEHQALLALVGDLLQVPENAPLSVRLRFTENVEPEPDADSGVFWLSPRP
jgi:hypothetical protein